MKVYQYTDEQLKATLGSIPYEPMGCPETMERTENPQLADCFFIPIQVGILEIRHPQRISGVLPTLARLPYWSQFESKHFFYMHSDEDAPVRTTSIVFRWSVNRNHKDPKTVTMPAPVEDLGRLVTKDYEGLPYHVTFVGYKWDPGGIREKCLASLKGCQPLNCYLDSVDEHFGVYETTHKGEIQRQKFLTGLEKSRLVLAPRGHGQHSYRPIEACSAGRIPVIIADDWQLPFEELVDWRQCAFFIKEADASLVHEKILEINTQFRPNVMAEMAMAGRSYFERWMKREKWGETTLHYLEKML